MPKRVQQTVERSQTEKTEEVVETPTAEADQKSSEKLKAELDDLMDEIDEALEKNALEFDPLTYQQKGGE